MRGESRIEEATRAMRAVTSLAELRGALSAWAPQFHDAVGKRVASGQRPDLGIDMSVVPGPMGSGIASKIGDSFFVSIGNQGRPSERRFALAHELGHVLMDAVDRDSVLLDAEAEEELCELFARRTVAPSAMVREYVECSGFPIDLGGVERFARRFRLSWRASLVVLDDFFPPSWPVAFIAASWRGHPRREEVLGMRIDASAADRRIFFPSHCRLSTLEYGALEAWTRSAAVGEESSGCEPGVRLRSRIAGVSTWVGDGEWTARLHHAPCSNADAELRGTICVLDVSKLVPVRPRARVRAKLTSAPEIPGQICMPTR